MWSLGPTAMAVLIAFAAVRASATETRRDILTHHHHHHQHHTARQLRTLATARVEDDATSAGDADIGTAAVVKASSADSDVDTSASDAAQGTNQADTSADAEDADSKDSAAAAGVASASDADASADTASADTDAESSVASAPAPAAAPSAAPASSPAAGPAAAEKKALEEMKRMLASERETFDENDPASKLREELASLIWLQDELKDQWAALAEPVYTAKIDMEQKVVSKETDMPGTANMLGNMRREMHKYASPFYRKVLEKQIANLQEEQKRVSDEIEDTEEKEGKDTKEEAKEEKKKPKRAKTEAAAATPIEEAAGAVGVQKTAHIAGVGLTVLLVIGMFVCLCLLYSRSAHRE